MKILHVIDQLVIGGAEVLTINTVNSLSNNPDFEVHLLVTRQEGPLKQSIDSKVKYAFLQKRKRFDWQFYKQLVQYIKQNNIEIIHTHNTSYFSCALVKMLFVKKVKLIWHNHTGAYVNLEGMKLHVLKFLSKYFDVIINVNTDLNQWSQEKLATKQHHVLNNFARFSNQDKKTRLQGVAGKRMVCLAGLRPVKDHINLIHAFDTFLKDFPEWTLHLIGKNYEDDYAGQIVELILEKQLRGNVFFYDLRKDIKNILSQATIGVLVSKKEGFPISVLEYGLAKLPVILTDVGSNKKIVQNEKAIIPPSNYEALLQCMKDMASNEALRNEIAQDLYQSVVANFSEEIYISTLKGIYSNV
jgi:glycosyltransferase involved in cell wall biosynthesis